MFTNTPRKPTIMKLIAIILLAIISVHHAAAQTTPADSVQIARLANHDAGSFKLNPDDRKKFKVKSFPRRSDYFKPTAVYTSNPAMLNDSLYVQTFRDAAFSNTVKARPGSFRDRLIALHPQAPDNNPPPRFADGIEKIAKKDAESFHMDNARFKQFTDSHFPMTSDYFKPAVANVPDASLLNDSSYVRAYRTAAYYYTLRRPAHVGRTLAIVFGSIGVGLVLFVALLVAATTHH